MKKFKLLMIYLLSFNSAFAINYFVDKANGFDFNSGLTTANAFKTIQKAANTAQAGSTIFIKAGTYFENVTISTSGTAGNPIIFRNFNNDAVFIDGTGTSTANDTAMLRINGASHLEFRNLTIQNLLCQDANGIVVLTDPNIGTTDLKFINITIHDIKWTALPTTIPTTNDNAHPFLVYGFGDTQATAITNVLVDGCNIYNNVTGFSENLTHSGNVDGFVVQNNLVHDNNNIGIECEGNYAASPVPALDHARNGLVKNNKCYNNTCPYSSAAGIYVDGGWDIIVERNECYNNSYGVEVGCEENGTTKNITVKNNIFYNNRESGVYLGGYDVTTTGQVLNTTIRNNTFFQNNSTNSSVGEIEISKASNCRIENNIFYVNNTKVLYNLNNIVPQINNAFDYNCYFTPNNNQSDVIIYYSGTGFNNFNAYKTTTNQDIHSIYGDPLFVNAAPLIGLDLNLQPTSPCINIGNPTIFLPNELDFIGNIRALNGVDIGAYEFQGNLITNNFLSNDEIKIYPTPVVDFVNIESKMEINSVAIYNEIGIVVYTNDEIFLKIDISNLNSGIYLMKINFKNDKVEVVKMLKL